MTKLEFDFKYSLICGEDPIGECIHSGNIEVEGEGITTDLCLEKVTNALESIAADISESKKEGIVYGFGSAKKEDLLDDIIKLVTIELDKKITAVKLDLER